ncbi:hypothetical protein [Rothia sp. 11273D007AR]
MTHTLSRRNVVKGGAWAAPVVVATAAVPAYAASSLVCPTDYLLDNPGVYEEVSIDTADGYHIVLFSYAFTSTSRYTTITFVASDEVVTFDSFDAQNYTINSDNRTITVVNDGALDELGFDVYVKVPATKVREAESTGGYTVSVNFTIDGECATTDGFSDFSRTTGIRE